MENRWKKDDNSNGNSNGKLMEEGCRRPIMGENVETGSQTGCHYPISPRRQIVLFKKHKQNNQPLTLKDVCAVQSRKAKKN